MRQQALTVLTNAIAWYDARIQILGILVNGIDTIPGERDEIALDAFSAARIATGIDRGIGRALMTAGDGSLYYSIATYRLPVKGDKTLAEAWL